MFQTFNLLANLSAFENVELPMTILGKRNQKDRKKRAAELLTCERALLPPNRRNLMQAVLSGWPPRQNGASPFRTLRGRTAEGVRDPSLAQTSEATDHHSFSSS